MAIIITFYISTGAKNAMYTLRQMRLSDTASQATNQSLALFVNNHICTLSADEDKAIEKARNYVEAYRDRVGESENLKIVLHDDIDIENVKRRGKLSVKDTKQIVSIENGIFPFGKYVNTKIEEAPDSYILYWADKVKENLEEEVVAKALAGYCLGIALSKELIKKRDEKQKIQLEKDLKSKFIGKVGETIEFNGVIVSCNEIKEYIHGEGYLGTGRFKNKILCGDDIVFYTGKKMGEVNEEINFKGTIKLHYDAKGINMTIISRPY